MPDCIYYINKLVLRTHARKATMGSITKRGPITSPVIRDEKPMPDNGFTKRPNPGKGKVPRPPITSPGGPAEEMDRLPDPNQEAGTLASTVGQAVGRVGQAVTGNIVPTVTQIAQQNQKKGPRRRQPTQGTLGSSGSLL